VELPYKKLEECMANFPIFLKRMHARCDNSEIELFAITARRIWLRKNVVVHGDSFTHPS
jgi:hypothetical protein